VSRRNKNQPTFESNALPEKKDDVPVLEVKDLKVTFPSEDGAVHAVRGVNFTLRNGEVLGIVGESGSGKSVTLNGCDGSAGRGRQD
jgi:peptide/nickel transport system ATP-binding protein